MAFIHSVWQPKRPEGVPPCASYFRAHGEEEGRWRACRRRGCQHCGPGWLAMQYHKMRLNLAAIGGNVVLISITAPGAERLPWACPKDHKHSGGYGCKVDRRAAREWAEYAPDNWKSLRDAARLAVKRVMRTRHPGYEPSHLVIERVWEPQKRGVPHLHVVAAARTPIELEAVQLFHQELVARATHYGFGEQLHITQPMAGAEAARYLAGYLLGRNGRKSKKGNAKPTIRENLGDPLMPRLLIWETPAIGSVSRSERMVAWRERLGLHEGTGVTIRRLRYARWYLAALKRKASVYPQLEGDERIAVAKVAALLERGPPDSWKSHAKTLRVMRLLQEAA